MPDKIKTALTDEECTVLASLASGKIVLELGSQYGASTICMAATAKQVHSVDWHWGDAYAGFNGDTLPEMRRNLVSHKTVGVFDRDELIICHVGKFQDVLPMLREESFDLIFVDGSHAAKDVEGDIRLASPLLAQEGVWVFHDYGVFPGVALGMKAVLGQPSEIRGTLAIVYAAGTRR